MEVMQERAHSRRILPRLAAVFLFAAVAAPAIAADLSPWDNDTRSAVRLVAARAVSQSGGRLLRAGIELKLHPGWKTYWRYPGDSGVPPVFDFTGSENVKTVTVLWPAPERFSDGGGNSIGYQGNVIFPLRVAAQDDGKPVMLRLKLDYAVCEKLCVPAKAKVELMLSGDAGIAEVALAAAEARVPKPTALGAGQALAIRSVERIAGARWPRIIVDVATLSATQVDLFAEGPTPKWALPLPQPIPSKIAGRQRFGFDLDGLPPGVKPKGAVLKFTAVSPAQAIEVEYRLD
jgi:DsbC/DsbD-like thiol-disulfide interchange protein